ncbi:hypothetical protein [Hoeflea prorocentri]|uniref:Uncharacterized protein n=1 Tax=Hoeflea prorocentri TaxID=1922333 RepID=A0A9X3ZH13_9HYPH|nr:hypothetical protein [Hoeflea prorocentri]MCY6380789.1 hypothetical protein [Hoeflea prorocentri]MDA5398589.1 hypothetical protein [Hoeflea prorocentri]
MTAKFKVAFAGLARDCAHALPGILAHIEDIASDLDDWGYVFFENNSVDTTLKLLGSFDAKHGRGLVASYGDLQSRISSRTERLALLRNRCVDEILTSERMRHFDFLIMIDLDAVNETIDKARLLELMQTDDPRWDAVFANQSDRYYDIWALRHPTWSPDDCWKRVRERPPHMTKKEAEAEFVFKRQERVDPARGFIEVESAFGGLGMYRLDALDGCRYVGLAADGIEVCEHVAFHRDMRKNGSRLYVDATLINGSGGQPHDSGMSRKTRLLRKLNKKLGR